MISIMVMYAFFASTLTINKAVLSYAQPVFYVAVRMLLGGVLLLCYQLLRNRDSFSLIRTHSRGFLSVAFFQIYCSYVIGTLGLQYQSSVKVGLLFALTPFITVVFSYFWFSECLTLIKLLGLLIGFSGFIPILLTSTPQEQALGNVVGFISWPELATLSSVIAYAYGWIVTRRLVKYKGVPPVLLNGASMFFGGFWALMSSPLIDSWDPWPVSNFLYFIGLLLLVVIIGNLVVFNLYASLLKTYTATLVAFVGFTEPIFTAVYGNIFLHEKVTWHFFASFFIIFLGLYLFYKEELKQGYIES